MMENYPAAPVRANLRILTGRAPYTKFPSHGERHRNLQGRGHTTSCQGQDLEWDGR